MTDREKQFLSELANVLERHGLTIERHTFHDSNYPRRGLGVYR